MPFTIAITPSRVPLRTNYWMMAFMALFLFVWVNSFLGTTDVSNWLLENTLVFFIPGIPDDHLPEISIQ
jgi:putative membrane protein